MRPLLPLILCAIVLCGGCKTSTVTGGQSRQETKAFKVTVTMPAGGQIVATDDRDATATTQPSVTTSGDSAKFTSDPDGGFNFSTKNVVQSPTAWGLIGLLIVAGVGFYLVRNWAGIALCGAGIVLAFVYPAALVWIALAAIGWVIYSHRAAFSQVVEGAQKGIEKLPEVQQETVKDELEKAQAPNVKTAVAAVKAGM